MSFSPRLSAGKHFGCAHLLSSSPLPSLLISNPFILPGVVTVYGFGLSDLLSVQLGESIRDCREGKVKGGNECIGFSVANCDGQLHGKLADKKPWQQ